MSQVWRNREYEFSRRASKTDIEWKLDFTNVVSITLMVLAGVLSIMWRM